MHRGWWLVTSVYLVVDAGLDPAQLVLIGVAQAATGLVFEVPAGVLADRYSRKWSLVVSHLLMGTAMLATGLVTDFGPLVATQMVWGLSWTFASGTDVAWITDQVDEPITVLMRAGRAEKTGAVAGMVSLGGVAGLAQRDTAMVLAGAAMILLAGYVATAFTERERPPRPRLILSQASTTARANKSAFAATFLVSGVAGAFGRLYPLSLVGLGMGPTGLLALGALAYLAGAMALRAMQPHVHGVDSARRGYAFACLPAIVGVLGLAAADTTVGAGAAVLLAAAALPLPRTFGTIWVNELTGSLARATVHSLLALAEYVGVILCGLLLAATARLPQALVVSGVLLAIAILVVQKPSTRSV